MTDELPRTCPELRVGEMGGIESHGDAMTRSTVQWIKFPGTLGAPLKFTRSGIAQWMYDWAAARKAGREFTEPCPDTPPGCKLHFGVICGEPCSGCKTWQGNLQSGHEPPYLWRGVDEYGRTYDQAHRAAMYAKEGKDEHGIRCRKKDRAAVLQQFMRDGVFTYPKPENYRTPSGDVERCRAEYLESLARAKDEECKKLDEWYVRRFEGTERHAEWVEKLEMEQEVAKELWRMAAEVRAIIEPVGDAPLDLSFLDLPRTGKP